MIFSTPQKWKTKKSLRGPKRALRGMNIFYPIYGAQGPYSIVMQLYCSPASFYALMYKANSWRMTSSVYVLIIIFPLLKGHILYFHTKQYSYPFNLRHQYNFMFFSRKQIRHLTMLYSTLTNWILYIYAFCHATFTNVLVNGSSIQSAHKCISEVGVHIELSHRLLIH